MGNSSLDSERNCVDQALQWVAAPYGTLSLLGLAANVFTVVVILRSPALRTPGGCIMVSLSFANTLGGILAPLTVLTILANGGCIGQAACSWVGYGVTVTASVSFFSHLLLSLDRHEKIVNPLHYAQRVTTARVVGASVCVWGFVLLLLLPAGTGSFGRINFYPEAVACFLGYDNIDPLPVSVYALLIAAGPNVGVFVCYFRIWRVSMRHSRQIAAQMRSVQARLGDDGEWRTDPGASAKNKGLRTVILLMASFYLCRVPIMTSNMLRGFFGVQLPVWVDVILYAVMMSDSILNCVIYYVTFKMFQDEARRLLRMKCQGRGQPSAGSTSPE